MELLIPGLLLVGLMVYLSTKIKRVAAEAYEREEIETDDFSLVKPDGFLHPLNSNSGLAFEAHSKEFGEDEARKIRHARAELEVHEGGDPAEIVKNIKLAAENILSEETLRESGNKAILVDAERLESGVPVTTLYKIAVNGSKIYEMRISILDEFKEGFLEKSKEMRASFRLK